MSKKKILPHDRYVMVHNNDPALTPIVLTLPDPPDLKLIDGYGMPIEEQKFRRMNIPEALKRIEKEAVQQLNDEAGRNGNKTVTLYKIQQKFWDILYSNEERYQPEISFIKRFWWHRIHGYWFFNRGKPTYITGWHFFYLNVWTMDTQSGENMPDYRDRDRKEFLFKKYAHTTTETFKFTDNNNYAVCDENGVYEMVDVGRRICFGVAQSKHRRSGNTNKGLCDCSELVTRTERMDGMVIMSHSGNDAEKHYKTKMLPSFDDFPIWIKPLTTSGRESSEIVFSPKNNDYAAVGLRTKIVAATTGGDKAVDGQKLISALMDEEGKTKEYDVNKRWGVVKQCLSQGNGRIIHGWTYHPSTVEEMSEGGIQYRLLLENSNFYKRMPNGQTVSGMFRLFIPSDEGLDDFIDPYGYSLKGELEDYQKEAGFTETATEYLMSQRDTLLKDGSPAAMAEYRGHKKRFPLQYDDSWLGDNGDIGFPLEQIDARQAELRRQSLIKKGNLEWVDGVYGGDVYFQEDYQNGRFEVSMDIPDHVRNKKQKVDCFSIFEGKVVPMWRPKFTTYAVAGVDPFRFRNKQEDMLTRQATGKHGKMSNGGISVLLNKSEEDTGSMDTWKGYRFILSYSNRPSDDVFNEDVLKSAVYTCSMVYPETNVGNIFEYFIKNGFGGYLLYDIDKHTGKQKDKPGVHNMEASKQEIFALTKEYLEYRCHIECHDSYLTECKRIKSLEEMTAYDRFAAHGIALRGAQSIYPKKIENSGDYSFDINEYVETYNYD